jgi:two-component system, NarL family, response regulator
MTYQNSKSDQAENRRTGSSAKKARIQIVVADDHPIVREGVVANLKQQRDLKVIGEANNGAEVLEFIKQHQPDIALLDLRMPRMNGLEVLLALNELKLQTKVIVMTAFENEEDIQHSMKAGARAYLLKGCPQETLVDAIRRVFNGEVYLPPQIAQKLVDRMQKPQISPRELEVLRAVAAGKSNKEIGAQLFISEGTVKTHVESLLDKLGAATRTSAVKAAVRRGLVQMA